MRNTAAVLACVLLVACAGNPPAWWNPEGKYGQANNAPVQTEQTESSSAVWRPVKTAQEDPTEQQIEVNVEEYEEMSLAPLEVVYSEAEEDQEPSVSSAPTAEVPELPLGENDFLPPPSVLE